MKHFYVILDDPKAVIDLEILSKYLFWGKVVFTVRGQGPPRRGPSRTGTKYFTLYALTSIKFSATRCITM